MITVNCPKCGAAADIDEKREESIVCKHCKTVITLEKAAPEKYKELIEAREKTEQRYKNILKDYEGGNDAPLKNAMHKIISSTDTADFNINRWFDFIFDAVNIGIKKKDTTNLEILKAHARKFDDAFSDYNASDRRLYDSLVFLHPEILNDSEWKFEFEKASADKADVQLLKNNILKCVKEKKEPKLLISVLNVLSASQAEFKDIGEEFLNSILDDEEIANILSVSFFKKARGGNFAKKLKKYVSSTFKDSEVILKDTLVWNNAEKVQKQRKNQKIIIASSVLGAIAIAVLAIFLFRNAMVKNSLMLEKPSPTHQIKMVYSENPDLTGYAVIFKKNDGTLERVPVTVDMLSGFDKEKIGMQTVKVTYKGKSFNKNEIVIEITAKQLERPTNVSIVDNKLIWDRMANAEGYDIYLSKASGAVGVSKYSTVADKAGNATLIFDLTNVNDMGNVFYATVVAYNTTEKYSDSEKSDEIKVTKLSVPVNIRYDKDTHKLAWSAVEGAKSYTIEINDAPPIRDIEATEIENINIAPGDNSITVTAFPTEQNVIMSVSKVNIHKLLPVVADSAVYSGNTVTWEANSQSNFYNIYRNGESVAVEHSGKAYDVTSWAPGVYTIKIEVASKSLEKITSEPTEFKIHIGTGLSVGGGKINWSSLGGNSYEIYVNGEKFESSSTTEKEKNIADIATAAGEYKIYVKVDETGISETVTVKKLSAPVELKVNNTNQTLTINGPSGANYVVTYNYENTGDKPFNNFTEFVAAGDYVITVVNKAVEDNEIDSDIATITVTKLKAPVISIIGGDLYADDVKFESGNAAFKWYNSNGAIISGPSFINPEEELTVYAITKATEANQLDSEKSNELTVEKLPKPILSYTDGDSKITCSSGDAITGGTLNFFKNGSAWDENINELPAGESRITAKYISTGGKYLNSEPSNEILIAKVDVRVSVSDPRGDHIVVKIETQEGSLFYEIEVRWYDAVGEFQQKAPPFPRTGFNGATTVFKNFTKLAEKAEVTVKIYDSQGKLVSTLPTVNWP